MRYFNDNAYVQVRQHKPLIAAQTDAEANFDDAGNKVFNHLFRNIYSLSIRITVL